MMETIKLQIDASILAHINDLAKAHGMKPRAYMQFILGAHVKENVLCPLPEASDGDKLTGRCANCGDNFTAPYRMSFDKSGWIGARPYPLAACPTCKTAKWEEILSAREKG